MPTIVPKNHGLDINREADTLPPTAYSERPSHIETVRLSQVTEETRLATEKALKPQESLRHVSIYKRALVGLGLKDRTGMRILRIENEEEYQAIMNGKKLLSRKQVGRIKYLFNIYYHFEDKESGKIWIQKENEDFEKRSPLEIMFQNDEGMIRVANYLISIQRKK